MSDDLAVGGPGSTFVVTTELEQEAALLSQLAWEMEGFQRELGAIDRVVGNGMLGAADAPLSAINAEQSIDEATAAMAHARDQCDRLHSGLSLAAERYEWTEHTIGLLQQHVAAQLGHLLGTVAPVLVPVILPGIVIGAGGVALFLASLPEHSRAQLFSAIGSWLTLNSGSLTDPRVVAAVRLSVMSADDVGAGVMRVPPQIATALGDEGLGIVGPDTSAFLLMGVGAGFGLFRETPVRVTPGTTTNGVSSVDGIQDRLERIPSTPEQIRIDRYSSPEAPDRFEVYIGGTEDFSPISGGEPFDLTSNVSAMAGGNDGSGAGSYRAVVEAMERAGIDSTSHVELNGYSQGGLIAAQLAASGDYTVDGLITIAGPAGHVAVPHEIPYLALEHSDDLVPALGGEFSSSDPLVVTRRAFDEPPTGAQPVMPAHRLNRYIDTAALIDNSPNVRLRETLAQLSHPHSESGTSTVFLAERVTQ